MMALYTAAAIQYHINGKLDYIIGELNYIR